MTTIGLPRTLRAEFAVWRRGAVARLPLSGLAFGLVAIALFFAAGTEVSWSGALGFQNLWAVFAGPMLTALLVATAARVENASRGGGTWYRPVRPGFRRLSRFTVLATRSLLLNALAVLPLVLVIGALSDPTSIPWGRTAAIIVVLWASQLGVLSLLLWLSLHVGWLVVLGAGLMWTVLGVVLAESPSWAALPFTWLVRGVLPLIGTHANGIALEPGAALAAASPWPPTMLGAALAVPFLLLPRIRTATRAPRSKPVEPQLRWTSAEVERPGRPRVLAAVVVILRGTALRWLCPAAVALIGVWLTWHDPGRSVELFTLVVLPIGTLVLGLLAWYACAPGWRATAARSTGTTKPALALTGVAIGITAAVSVASAAVYLVAGLPLADAGSIALTGTAVGAMLTAFSLWLAIRTSFATAVAVGVVGVLAGILIGGTEMQRTLWPLVPWAWADLLDRMLITVPVSIAAAAALGFAIATAARRAASR
ncbi:hypothetical protein F1721_14725 [Saccharopolyspora hirsuta]|uniref:Uncharacterized protein n=1 Tax=Saccharopolyspora hirsuta TaxID=1837 RepID=A0A5M7BWL5_SACHI|nr:hypothetical protein [Saccharopolyspora hirsuta]KAA5833530.1 hypothetical protein F1721_14725 [Saccharopolyspora hirsuta]